MHADLESVRQSLKHALDSHVSMWEARAVDARGCGTARAVELGEIASREQRKVALCAFDRAAQLLLDRERKAGAPERGDSDHPCTGLLAESWHAIEGPNGMCACGVEKGGCKERLAADFPNKPGEDMLPDLMGRPQPDKSATRHGK